MMTSVREQNAEIFGLKEHEIQKCTQMERQIRVERRRNARSFEALNFRNRAGCVNPISGKVDFDGF